MTTELFDAHFLNMNRGSPFIQEVSGVYNSQSLNGALLSMALRAQNVSGLPRKGPQMARMLWN